MKASIYQTNCLCVVCTRQFVCAHYDEVTVKRRILIKTHKDKPPSLRQQPINVVPQNDPFTFKISRTELFMTKFIVQNNLSIAVL